jgi:hypothetical protein
VRWWKAARCVQARESTSTCSATRNAWVGARLRCSVAAIDAESGVTYRAALAFSELPVDS